MEPDATELRLAMVAGEASGDLLAGMLLAGLKARWPTMKAAGIGGPRMAAQGFESWWPHDKLAVRGYAEVLRHYREIASIRKALIHRLSTQRPDAFIGIDAPDFNLHVEATLKAQGVKSIHFVSPSIWAWRANRIELIRKAVDHVLCVFPFEPALYERAGIAATFVGHPLADAIPMEVPRAASRASLGLSEQDVVVALLPGSRRSEVIAMAPRFLAAAARMSAKRAGLRFVLPVSYGMRSLIEPMVARARPGAVIELLAARSHEALAACDVALVASGTATLEAALFKRPMVIAYSMNWLSWQLMRRMALQPWVGLPNILLKDFVVPEFLQDQATPEKLACAAIEWLDNPSSSHALERRFQQLHSELRCNTALAATHVIAHILDS